jgi:membrane protease YdiL (CAAX protease family)
MEDSRRLDYFIDNTSVTWTKRIVAVVSCVLVYLVWRYVAIPYVQPVQRQMFAGLEGGLKRFVTNVILYNSFLYAVLSVIAIFLLIKAGIFRLPSLKRNLKSTIFQGLLVGFIILILSIGFQLLIGSRFHLNFDAWEFGGNLFSNAYEEIFYRGFIFVGLLYFFRRAWPAVIISGLMFGLTHTQYPLGQQMGVALIGAAFGFLYYRTGNLLAPWIAHQVVDLLDSFFKM